MKITDIRVVLHARPAGSLAVFGTADTLPMGVLRVLTDEGIEGNAFLSLPVPGPRRSGRRSSRSCARSSSARTHSTSAGSGGAWGG